MNERISLSVTMKDGSTKNIDWCDWVTSASCALTTAEDLVFYVGDTIEDDDRLTDAVKIVADEVLFDGSKVVSRVSAVIKDTVWYAVQEDSTDGWDNGSYDYNVAVEMLKDQGHGLIAVINEATSFCVEEIHYQDL